MKSTRNVKPSFKQKTHEELNTLLPKVLFPIFDDYLSSPHEWVTDKLKQAEEKIKNLSDETA